MRALFYRKPLIRPLARNYSHAIPRVKEPYLDISDFTKNEQIFTEYNRHELYHATHSSGKEFVLKKMNANHIWNLAQESNVPIELLGCPEEETKFLAETEAFLSSFMQKLAPEHTPNSVRVVLGQEEGVKEYYVASEFKDNYISFNSLEIKGKEKFFVGDKGETRLLLSIEPFKHIAIYGRIHTKLAVNAIVEWDDNPENLGVICDPSKINMIDDLAKKHPIFSIDHEAGEELCRQPDARAAKIFETAKAIALGHSFSIYGCMDLNHLQIARREEVRKESVKHIYNVFKEQFLSPDLFQIKLSRDYTPNYQEKIYNIGGNLQIKGATFAAANALIQNGWDKSNEHADSIFKEKYSRNYNILNQHHIWAIETNRDQGRFR
jgi:hypothetical protein